MAIPPEYYDLFFESMVRDQETAQQLQSTLIASVDAQAPSTTTERYAALRTAAKERIWTIADATEEAQTAQKWGKIALNAEFGMNRIVDGLQSVGTLYESSSANNVPQQRDNVERNVHKANGNTLFIAGQSSRIAMANLVASHYGLDPHDKKVRFSSFWHRLTHQIGSKDLPQSFAKAYSMEADPVTGQLSLELRHRWLQQPADKRREHGCPAAKVQAGPAEAPKNGLYAYAGILGNIAITKIYPHQFKIAD